MKNLFLSILLLSIPTLFAAEVCIIHSGKNAPLMACGNKMLESVFDGVVGVTAAKPLADKLSIGFQIANVIALPDGTIVYTLVKN